ncbi:MAG: glycosyltransferase [Nitriliruptorales bacterium]|nr:glycosyltransferase [Nitriliruptorales bacterium]
MAVSAAPGTPSATDPTGSPPEDARPSDRTASVRRVGLLSVHTSPLEQPGRGDSGGMNVYLTAVARRLVQRDVEVHVFTRTASGDLAASLATSDGVRVHHISAGPMGLSKGNLASHLCAFYLGFAAHPITPTLDLVHGHYWMSGWVGRHARRRLGLPLVQSFHTLARAKNAGLAPGDAPESALRLTAEDRIVAAADAVVAPTGTEAALLRDRYPARPQAIRVVEPGVDLDVFTPEIDRHAARQAIGGGRILLFVGRLQPLKAPDLAVRTLAALDDLLPDDGIPTRLVVVGGASGSGFGTVDPPALRGLARELGIADRVAFLAPRRQPELATLYRAADVVLMPSYSESFGLVALEAQASGTPVVASAVGGLRHVVKDGVGGTLVGDHDPRSFASAAARYLTDARLRAAVGEAGRDHALRYSWDRTADGTLEVYADVLEAQDEVVGGSGRLAGGLGG